MNKYFALVYFTDMVLEKKWMSNEHVETALRENNNIAIIYRIETSQYAELNDRDQLVWIDLPYSDWKERMP